MLQQVGARRRRKPGLRRRVSPPHRALARGPAVAIHFRQVDNGEYAKIHIPRRVIRRPRLR